MKTIKQIADELGVSKTAVRQKIENLGLRSSLRKDGNQFAIDEEQEKLIKSSFSDIKSGTKSQTANCKPVSENREVSDLVSTLQNEISTLQNEINEKNQQINELQKSLSDSQRMLDQQQQLTAMSEQRVLQLEDKQSEDQKHWWQFWK